jgi:pimeloyl-ACP methyl ester carboxylesterase
MKTHPKITHLLHAALLASLLLSACQTSASPATEATRSSNPPATSPIASANDASPAPDQLVLGDCDADIQNVPMRGEARCGCLSVWEDPASGSGRQIKLHVAVLPAVSRNKAADPLFFIAGGPGEAASESYAVLSAAFDTINQKRDIILVDQRGTGLSNALECDFEDVEDSSDLATPFKQCLAQVQEHADPRFYTTAIAMDDLDRVRQALGYAQINIYGVSYGSRAALAYMRQHPDRVRSVILDGVVPMGWVLGVEAPADAQRAIDLQFDRCAKQPECAQAFPNVRQEFQDLLSWLESEGQVEVKLDHPISGEPTTVTLDKDSFANLVHLMSYAPESTALLPLLIHTAHTRHDFQRFAAITLSTEGVLSQSISAGMRMSVACAEDQPFMHDKTIPPGYLGDFTVRVFNEVCSVWPRGSIPAGFTDPVRSNAPTLLISGEFDPVTPPENAEQAAQTLPNSLHIVVPGMGHANVHRGCLPRIATDFIESGAATGLDTACVQDIQPMPFFINFNGPQP